MGWGSPGLTSCSVHTKILVCVRTLAPLICFIFCVIRITSPFTRCVSQAFWGMALLGACTSTPQHVVVHRCGHTCIFPCLYVFMCMYMQSLHPTHPRSCEYPSFLTPLPLFWHRACSVDDASHVVAIKVRRSSRDSHLRRVFHTHAARLQVMPRALSDSECATEAPLMQVYTLTLASTCSHCPLPSPCPLNPLSYPLQKLAHPHILKIHRIISDDEHMCGMLLFTS